MHRPYNRLFTLRYTNYCPVRLRARVMGHGVKALPYTAIQEKSCNDCGTIFCIISYYGRVAHALHIQLTVCAYIYQQSKALCALLLAFYRTNH